MAYQRTDVEDVSQTLEGNSWQYLHLFDCCAFLVSPEPFLRLYGTDYEDGIDTSIGPADVSWHADVHFWACHLSFPSVVDAGTNEL